MALHNRDYMGGTAPSQPYQGPPGMPRFGAVTILILVNVAIYLVWAFAQPAFLSKHFLVSAENLEAGRFWVVLTGGFFHIDLFHLLTTVVMLYLVGKAVYEDTDGGSSVVLAYVLGSIAAALLLQVWYTPPQAGLLPPGPPPGTGSGSGFYVSERLLLTNAHVVSGESTVAVQIGPNTLVRGKVKARHERLDLALIEVDTKGTPLVLCEPSIKAGRTVFALGYGALLRKTDTLLTTRGAISAIQAKEARIVFDAKVNPGNSGGPLVDAGGRWVGVVAAKSHVGNGLDSLSFAVEGRAVATWIESVGGAVQRTEAAPQGSEPPNTTSAAVVRILTGGVPVPAKGPALFWFDPRIFGASGAIFALLGLVLFRRWRRPIPIFGIYAPLLVIALFFSMADLTGVLRTGPSPPSMAHGYHLAGLGVGFLLLRLEGVRGRLRGWLKARLKRLIGGKPPELRVLQGGKGVLPPLEVPDTFPPELELPSKLDAATRARMDEILGIISERGISALSPEEKAFLDETSKKLKG